MDQAIIVESIEKNFRLYHHNRPKRIKELLIRGIQSMAPIETFSALKDVSFSVNSGQTIGIIGVNGSGKSTLLRLLANIGVPDKGSIKTQGRIRALLDLGAHFQPELTGRENLFLSGVIAGLTRKQITRHLDDIINFSELEAFIDSPLRTYSTGMQMRLAFAIATHTDPDILLIDEVLAVGDLAFQQKCVDRINRFKADGCTIVLVSHDMNMVEQLCDEVIWLRKGQVIMHSSADTVVAEYVASMITETKQRTPVDQPHQETDAGTTLKVNENRFGSLEMEIVTVRFLNAAEELISELTPGAPLCIEIEYHAPAQVQDPIFSVTISLEDGFICYDTTTELAGQTVSTVHDRGTIRLFIDRLDLNGGQYYVDVGVYESTWAYTYDYHWHVYPLYIQARNQGKGILQPPTYWKSGKIDELPLQPE